MRVMDAFHRLARLHHLADNTIDCYANWIEDFLRFSRIEGRWRHPRELRGPELAAFLIHLAADRKLSASGPESGGLRCGFPLWKSSRRRTR